MQRPYKRRAPLGPLVLWREVPYRRTRVLPRLHRSLLHLRRRSMRPASVSSSGGSFNCRPSLQAYGRLMHIYTVAEFHIPPMRVSEEKRPDEVRPPARAEGYCASALHHRNSVAELPLQGLGFHPVLIPHQEHPPEIYYYKSRPGCALVGCGLAQGPESTSLAG